jgi:flavin-dependent dehydrogenase
VKHYDVIIIGGGLAGLTAAIHLKKKKYNILLLEKERFPHHKVCGEYLSREVVPYLAYLEIRLSGAAEIDTLEFSAPKGRSLTCTLPLGGLGISRFALDNTLYEKAVSLGVSFSFCTARSVTFRDDLFTITTNKQEVFNSRFIIGAFGKRSNLDVVMNRPFVKKKSPWLGIKAHYRIPDFPDNVVALHNFPGGYGGLSKTETGDVNFCYLVTYDSFQKYRDIDKFNAAVVSQNPYLASFLSKASILFDKPLSIAQISFEKKHAVEDHVLMCGDSAGLIHPLCGNGMAMAIHSAKLASECIDAYFREGKQDRKFTEMHYAALWKETFGKRIAYGRYLQTLLMSPGLSNSLIGLTARSPRLLNAIVKRTHGNPIEI